jgi:hypothetical protein
MTSLRIMTRMAMRGHRARCTVCTDIFPNRLMTIVMNNNILHTLTYSSWSQ